jgi:alpha-glucuronidase
MKRYSYLQLESLMFKAWEDAQNGVETTLGRQVRESLEAQEKQAQEAAQPTEGDQS